MNEMNIREKLYNKDDPFNFDIPRKIFKDKYWRERYSKRRRCAYLRFGGIGQCDMWEDEPHVHNGEMTLITTNYNHREDKLYDFTYNKESKKVEIKMYFQSFGQLHLMSEPEKQVKDEIKKLKKYMQSLINRRLNKNETVL